ncbi:MAG: hypothetical protein HZB50_03565 [Chloroflexi bacterium]|nr:hypothetical protein [Chloroflexota bacterium]
MDLFNQIIYNIVEVHPLHPLIVHFPIALTSAALFFMLLALWRRSDELEQVAFANLALAAVSSVVAGITGMMDNKNTYDGAAPNASAKIVLASILLAISLFVIVARWRKPNIFHSSMPARALYIGSYFVNFGLVTVLGFLGGVILYGFHELPKNEITENNVRLEQAHTFPTPTSNPDGASIAVPSSGISFTNEVFPIIKSRCVSCHGGQKTEEGLDLTSYEGLMVGSENGPVIIPGDAMESILAKALIEREMPKRGPKLSPSQAQIILDWISQGARDN